MSPDQLSYRFDNNLYNGLLTIEAANAAVRERGQLAATLDDFAKMFIRHGVEDRFGIALLHKHSRVDAGEHMIEFEEAADGAPALVTRPTREAPSDVGAAPIVWALRGESFAPLEYATDSHARALFGRAEIPDAFIEDFARASKASPIGHLLGLSVVERGFFAAAKENEVPVEHSHAASRSNIVVLQDLARTPVNSIETRWRFRPGAETMSNCIQECVQRCHPGENNQHSGHKAHWAPEHTPA